MSMKSFQQYCSRTSIITLRINIELLYSKTHDKPYNAIKELRWEFIKNNKNSTKKPTKKTSKKKNKVYFLGRERVFSCFLDRFFGRVLVFLISCFLLKIPTLLPLIKRPAVHNQNNNLVPRRIKINAKDFLMRLLNRGGEYYTCILWKYLFTCIPPPSLIIPFTSATGLF